MNKKPSAFLSFFRARKSATKITAAKRKLTPYPGFSNSGALKSLLNALEWTKNASKRTTNKVKKKLINSFSGGLNCLAFSIAAKLAKLK